MTPKWLACAALGAAFTTACSLTHDPDPAQKIDAELVTEYVGASVFDGTQFVPRSVCTTSNAIVSCPHASGTTVELNGQFITPPFGDAHTHHFDGPFTLEWHKSLAFKSGTFYAMNMTAMTSEVTRIRDQLSGPGNVDVASSLGGITGPDSHPAEIYEALSLGFRSYEQQIENQDLIRSSRRVADNAYYVVQSPEDVKNKMALLLAQNPDHVKVYLRHSERYRDGWGKWGPGGGTDPELLMLIADIANAAEKRVTIATSSVYDFRAALGIGAYNATHVPCYQDTESDTESPYFDLPTAEDCLLTGQDAARAAQIGMSTTFIVAEWANDRPAKYLEWEKLNAARLRASGAPIVFGVNTYGSTITDGLIAGADRGIFEPADLLEIATMATPKMIFPQRNVGCLDPGCEASMIAFSSNPLEDMSAIRDISFRLKDGLVIED